MDGALLIDKPAGITSAKCIAKLKKKFNLRKIGHCGTLDPMATGLLIALIGNATKVQDFLMEGKKEYSGVIIIGKSTTTDDIEGEVISVDEKFSYLKEKELSEWEVELKKEFTGQIKQVPPQVSAIKIDGQAAYKKVRKGEELSLSPREIEIFSLDLKFLNPYELSYKVCCSKGTYVRSIARDIGRYLGTQACLKSIRRTSSSPFNVSEACDIDKLEAIKDRIIPFDKLLENYPKVVFSEDEINKVKFGQREVLEGLDLRFSENFDIVRILDKNNHFISLATRSEEGWRTNFVIC